MKLILILVLLLGLVSCDDQENGGVSEEHKLKIDDTYKVEDCGMTSQQDDTIHWNYKGMLLDGHVFDTGKFKATLGHGHVIIGVDKGMRGLCVGDKRRMTMHADWGYGDRGVPGTIPPKSTLIFDVELTSIERPDGKVERLEDKLNGGVSAENKLKLIDTYKSGDCGMTSQQDDLIHWNYKGMLLDGHVFDSGKFKATLGHGDVITGVDKGMRGLCVGDKRRMTMHADWGYGDRGVPGTIPPKSTLIFDVELTSIERPDGKVERLEDKLNDGTPKENKLKIERIFEVQDCTLRSQEGDIIVWEYKGTFMNGTMFHKGVYKAMLGNNHMIKGMDLGMRDMCIGDRRRLEVHSDLAYGKKGNNYIPPNTDLIFEVKLKRINRDNIKTEL